MPLTSIAACVFRRQTSELVVPFAISQESLPQAQVVFVALKDQAGRVGIGEASPFPSLTYDTVEDVETALPFLLKQVEGLDSGQGLAWIKEKWQSPDLPSRSALAALEMALFDLYARQLNIPLMHIYGCPSPGSRPRIQTDLTVPMMSADHVEGFLRGFSSAKFQVLKVKVSGQSHAAIQDDIQRVCAVREASPRGTILTIDGNQGFEVDGVETLVAGLAKHGIRPAFFEQPLAESDWEGCARLARMGLIPVFLDEAIRFPADLAQAARDGLCQGINLKITKSGIRNSLQLAHMARGLGMELMIGGMLEAEIAMGHSLHLAAGFGGIQWFDLDTPFFFRSRFTVNAPWAPMGSPEASYLRVPEGPGLGLDLAMPLLT